MWTPYGTAQQCRLFAPGSSPGMTIPRSIARSGAWTGRPNTAARPVSVGQLLPGGYAFGLAAQSW